MATDIFINLKTFNKQIDFLWIPSHIGICGNEEADRHAKLALNLQIEPLPISYQDFKPIIKSYFHNRWQDHWNHQPTNKLNEIHPTIKHAETPYFKQRRYDIVYCRLKIGHTRLTHEYLLKREAQPICSVCNNTITIKHILLDCPKYANKRLFTATNLHDLFNMSSPEDIIKFIKDANIFDKM